jgi:O-methyltransferase
VQFTSASGFDSLVNRLRRGFGTQQFAEPIAGIYSGLMTNVEQRINMFHLVEQVLAYEVSGEVVELGCHEGQSAVLLQRVILEHEPHRTLHIYDSFEGLPEASDKDGSIFKAGWLATTEEIVRTNFRRYGLPEPLIHKGWFDKTLATDLPERIAFAHLDGDFYDSIKVSLEHVYPKLSRGAVCLVDDYCDPAANPNGWNLLPGVKRACDEFLSNKPEKMIPIYSGAYSHGFFRKL